MAVAVVPPAMSSFRNRAVLLVCLLVVAPTALSPATAQPTGIDGCTAITESGTYRLTANVTNASAGQCLRIRASDVVVDGGGHVVDGTGSFGTAGVVVGSWGERVSNVTVRNLTATDWDDGVRYTNVGGGHVANATASSNRVGFLFLDTSDVAATDVVATDNAVHGVSFLDASSRNRVTDARATGNALFGVHLSGDGTENAVSGTNASGNQFGVVLVGADGNALSNNTLTENRIAGAWLSASNENVLSNNSLSNRFYGVYLDDGSSGNALSGNEATGNAVGIRLRGSGGNDVSDNRVVGNDADGVLLIASDGNAVSGNVVTGNRRGISLLDSDDNTVTDNVVGSNAERGLVIRRGSANNTVRNNTARSLVRERTRDPFGRDVPPNGVR